MILIHGDTTHVILTWIVEGQVIGMMGLGLEIIEQTYIGTYDRGA
jgi:hypothetical protein